MPRDTLETFLDHGEVTDTLGNGVDEGRLTLERMADTSATTPTTARRPGRVAVAPIGAPPPGAPPPPPAPVGLFPERGNSGKARPEHRARRAPAAGEP